MDSTVGYDPTLPLDMDGSCNPDLLPEVTFTTCKNHLEINDGTVPLIEKQNSGRMSPVRAITMKEYDQIISELRKENFNLKLRIYFLEERMQQKYGDGDDIFKTNIELRVEVETLRKELTDKQDLLKKAGLAMENLTANHQMELMQVKGQIEAELKQQNTDLADKYNKSLLDSSVYQKDLQEAEEKIISLESMLDKVKVELDEIKTEKIQDGERMNEALKTIQDKDSAIVNLEDLVKKYEEDGVREKEKYDLKERQMKEELEKMKKHVERKERDIQNISSIMDTKTTSFNSESFLAPTHLQDAMEDQKENVKRLQGKLRESEKKLNEKIDVISRLQDQLYDLENENKALHNKINQSEEEKKLHEDNTFKRDKTIQGFVSAMKKKEKEITALREKLNQSEDQIEKLTEDLHKTNLANNKITDSMKEENVVKGEKIEFLENQMKNTSDEMEKLLKSLGKKDGELVGFKEMLGKAEEALKKSEEALEGLQEQLNQEKLDGQKRADKLAQHYQVLLEDVEGQVNSKEKLLHQLTQRLQDKDKQLHDYFNLLDKDQFQIEEGKNPVDLLKKLQRKLKEKETLVENLEEEKQNIVDEKESEIRNLKQSIREKDRDLNQANQMLVRAEDNVENLERAVEEKEENMKQLSKCLQAAQKSFEIFDRRLSDPLGMSYQPLDDDLWRIGQSFPEPEEAMDNHMRAIDQKTDMINRLKSSVEAKEAALEESIEKSPALSTDQVKKLKKQLKDKETIIQELLNEKHQLSEENETMSRDFFNRSQIKDHDIKSLLEKHMKEKSKLDKDIQDLQSDLNKRDLEIQRLENNRVWTEDQIEKLRDSMKEKDKTIEALFESGKEKDKLLQQSQTRSPSQSSSAVDLAHVQALQDEIAFLLNHLTNKDALINQLRGKTEQSPWQQQEIDRLSDELMKKNQMLKSTNSNKDELAKQLEELRKRVTELETQSQKVSQYEREIVHLKEVLQAKEDNSKHPRSDDNTKDLIREQLAEIKSLGDILRKERDIYITLDNQHYNNSSDGALGVELERIESLRRSLEEGVEKNNTLRIILEQQTHAIKPYIVTDEKLNKSVNTSQFDENHLHDLPRTSAVDINTSPIKFSRAQIATQTDITATTEAGLNKSVRKSVEFDASVSKFVERDSDFSLNLLPKCHLDSVDNVSIIDHETKLIDFTDAPSELLNLQNHCFSRISGFRGDTRAAGCDNYYSTDGSLGVSNESANLNPQETVLSSNKIHKPLHSPPELLRHLVQSSQSSDGNLHSSSLITSPKLLQNTDNSRDIHSLPSYANRTSSEGHRYSSYQPSSHLQRDNSHSSVQTAHAQSITNIESTKDKTDSQISAIKSHLPFKSFNDHHGDNVEADDVDVDRLSVDQSVLLSEDISNMSAPSLRKLVSKLQNDLMDSLQENHNLQGQVHNSFGSRQIPGKNETDPTTADLRVLQQKLDNLQLTLAKTQHENETLHQHLQSPNKNNDNQIAELKQKLREVENRNNLLKKQIELNSQTSSSPTGFNPELILEMATEIEKLKKAAAEKNNHASDSESSENGGSGCLAKDGTASPDRTNNGRRSLNLDKDPVKYPDTVGTELQGNGDQLCLNSTGTLSAADSLASKPAASATSHIPRLRRAADSNPKPKSAPVVACLTGENRPALLESLLQAARTQIAQLEEKLAATENTVRFQSSKMKYYRNLASDAGLIPKLSSRSQSETNLFVASTTKPPTNLMAPTGSYENLSNFNENGTSSISSEEYGKTENVTALKTQIDELINKLQRQTLEINRLRNKSFDRTCRSISPPNVSPRIKELKNQLRENVQSPVSSKSFIQNIQRSASEESQTIPEQDYIQNLKIRFPDNEHVRNSVDKNYKRSPSLERSYLGLGRNYSSKSRSQSDLNDIDNPQAFQKLLDRNQQLESELMEVKHDSSILAARLVELGQMNPAGPKQVENLNQKVRDLENEKETLAENLRKSSEKVEDLESKVKSYRNDKQMLEGNVRKLEQKLKWMEHEQTSVGADRELWEVQQQLYDSQNTCLQLRNQLEEISCFMSELINHDRGQSEDSSSVGVGVANIDRLKQHIQISREVINASMSDISRIEEKSRLDASDHVVTGNKYQSAVDEINKLQSQLNLQEKRSREKLAEKEAELKRLREELSSAFQHGIPEGCDSEAPSPQRSVGSADGQPETHDSGSKSRKSLTSTDGNKVRSTVQQGDDDFSVEQIRRRIASGRTDTRSTSSMTDVTDVLSERENLSQTSRLNLQRMFHSMPPNGPENTSFPGDTPNHPNVSYRDPNLSALYLSKMNESDFLLSDSHFCNQSNGSMFGGRLGDGLDRVDSSETRSKSSDTLSQVSSYKERSRTPSGSTEIQIMKARLIVAEDKNKTLQEELKVYENLVKNTGTQSSPNIRSGRGQGDNLHDHLMEIRALRLRLEKSLDESERLRLQLEERLRESQTANNDQLNYEKRVQELTNLVSNLRNQLEGREKHVSEKLTIIDEQEKIIHNTKILLEKQSNRINESDKRCQEMEKNKHKMEEKCKKVEESCRKLEENRQHMEINFRKHQERKERQELQLRKAGKEIRKLQQEILLWKEKAEEKTELNKTLKLELSMYEKLQANKENSSQSNLDITDLLTEIQHLRIQLEKCIDTNNRLRQTVEDLLHQQMKQSTSPRLDAGTTSPRLDASLTSHSSSVASEAADGRPSPRSSPRKSDSRDTFEKETYIHRKIREEKYEYDVNGVKTTGDYNRYTSEDRYTSDKIRSDTLPDTIYKIGSTNQSTRNYSGEDKSRYSTSIPHRCPNPNISIHSLPPDLDKYFDKESSVKYWVDTSAYKEVPRVDVDSDIRRLFAIGKLDDFEKVRKENEEVLSVLHGLQARVDDRIHCMKKSSEQSVEYSTLKEISLAIENLKICMNAEKNVIERFWVSQLPPVNELGEFYDAKLAEDNRTLHKEITRLKSEHDIMRHSARAAEQRLHLTIQQQQGMESAICQQLDRTNKILKQASANASFRATKRNEGQNQRGALNLADLTKR
ncbi:hypothetical protein SNE40_013639 [Patella caerulea]|uniref:Centrosomin N-terminal motif 1 domain-containing protein n=1 Tax=Patella caerulea TaxID=87958 RepID=A0AAN8JC04_PATCE